MVILRDYASFLSLFLVSYVCGGAKGSTWCGKIRAIRPPRTESVAVSHCPQQFFILLKKRLNKARVAHVVPCHVCVLPKTGPVFLFNSGVQGKKLVLLLLKNICSTIVFIQIMNLAKQLKN